MLDEKCGRWNCDTRFSTHLLPQMMFVRYLFTILMWLVYDKEEDTRRGRTQKEKK